MRRVCGIRGRREERREENRHEIGEIKSERGRMGRRHAVGLFRSNVGLSFDFRGGRGRGRGSRGFYEFLD